MDIYQYRSLDLDQRSLRLLRILKESVPDDIQCELVEGWIYQSEGGLPYDALSYVWGSTEKSSLITVNGKKLYVTENLLMALQHLCLKNDIGLLWIDAICIDQANLDERGHQVRNMSNIYTEAERVIVWLGSGSTTSDFIMDFMKRLPVPGNTKSNAEWRSQVQSTIETVDQRHQLRDGMSWISNRPWFKRIWILQEIANSRSALILCGSREISARVFAQVPALIGLQLQSHCQAVFDIMTPNSRKKSWWAQKRGLHTLLIKFQGSEATDERDSIYALLGLSSDAHSSNILRPDYNKSTSQVIRNTVSFLLSLPIQDEDLNRLPDWTLTEFFHNLGTLNSVVLGIASETGLEEIVEILLDRDIEVDYKCINNRTPLMRAAAKGHEKIARLLLQEGADIEATQSSDGRTSLSVAAANGHVDVVNLLLRKGAKLGFFNYNNNEPPLLFVANMNKQKHTVKLPMDDYKDNMMRMVQAARLGHTAVVQLLLENGFTFESKSINPLVGAAEHRHLAVAQPLLDYGTNLNDQNPLVRAAEYGQLAVVQILLDYGADINAKNRTSRTALSVASEYGHVDVVRLLVDRGADIESKDDSGRNPLFWAAAWGNEAVVKLLVTEGCNIEISDRHGDTPQAVASRRKHTAVLKILTAQRAKDLVVKQRVQEGPASHSVDLENNVNSHVTEDRPPA